MVFFIVDGRRTVYGSLAALKKDFDDYNLDVSGGYGSYVGGKTVYGSYICDKGQTVALKDIDDAEYQDNVVRGLTLTLFAAKR